MSLSCWCWFSICCFLNVKSQDCGWLCHKGNMGFTSKLKMCSVCYDEKCEFFLRQELVSLQWSTECCFWNQPKVVMFSMRLEKVTWIYTFVWLNCGDTSNGSDHFSRWWQTTKNWQVSAFHSLCLRVCTHARRSMCVCPITVSVSVLCIFSFLYRLSFGDDWTEFLFSLYADHTLIQCAGLPTATFSITQFCLWGAAAAGRGPRGGGRGHHRFDLWPVCRPASVEEEGREGQVWLAGEGERGVDSSHPLPFYTHIRLIFVTKCTQ